MTDTADAEFLRRAKQAVRGLLVPNPAIYWADFLVTVAGTYAALAVYLFAPLFSAAQVIGFFASAFLLHRAATFTHELAHRPRQEFRAFRVAWNSLYGIPFLLPSFLYTDHRVHHARPTYGTPGDGEYAPYARIPLGKVLLALTTIALAPIALVVRFGLLGPASLFSPRLRRWVWARASTLGTLSPYYNRAPAPPEDRRGILVQETGCFLVVVTVFVLLMLGVIPWVAYVKLYLVALFSVSVNMVRVLAAHRYDSPGTPLSLVDQVLDSTTIPGGLWDAVWAPLGLRFHALHHLFATMPYHNMGRAHRRLMRDLPPDSPYHRTVRPHLAAALWELVRAMRAESARRKAAR